MAISQRELQQLVTAGVIDTATAERITAHFAGASAGADRPRFDLTHTAYYLGALVVMSALGWFMNEAWARLSPWATRPRSRWPASLCGTSPASSSRADCCSPWRSG